MQIPKGVRRKLRAGLGSRSSRRSGTKSMTVARGGRPEFPAARLKAAIKVWQLEQANA